PTATRVARFLAHWSKGQTRISWRMAEVHNIAGFLVYAGHQRLTKQVIPASPGRRSYHLSAHVTRTAQLYLDVVLNTGKVNLFGPYRSR
ncbi:MAG: hypothetical protein M3Z66_08520, partial [Chloroflexota bacterium]|nr:hypothetical protein [Chloroflexota bacterium]